MTVATIEERESDTCQSEDKVKMMLVKEKSIKNDSHKSQSDTCKNRGAEK